VTAEDLRKLRAIADGATRGPWRPSASRTGVVAADDWWVATVSRITPVLDVEFIAASRAAVPALLDEVDRLRDAIADAIAIFDATWCPEHGHAPRQDQLDRIDALRKLVS